MRCDPRILCRLFGCVTDNVPYCLRCQAHYYEGDFVQVGVLQPVADAWRWLTAKVKWLLRLKRCKVCGKRMPWRSYDEYCCSDECYTNWLPF